MKLLVVTGMPGSGKEEFVDVSKQMGFDVVRMGDVVRMEASRRGIPLDDRSVGRFAHSERETQGYDVWAKRTVPFIKEEMTVIDGCRGGAELEVFKMVFGKDVTVVAIYAPRLSDMNASGRGTGRTLRKIGSSSRRETIASLAGD